MGRLIISPRESDRGLYVYQARPREEQSPGGFTRYENEDGRNKSDVGGSSESFLKAPRVTRQVYAETSIIPLTCFIASWANSGRSGSTVYRIRHSPSFLLLLLFSRLSPFPFGLYLVLFERVNVAATLQSSPIPSTTPPIPRDLRFDSDSIYRSVLSPSRKPSLRSSSLDPRYLTSLSLYLSFFRLLFLARVSRKLVAMHYYR